jgi:large subunit ribosomal protein L5
MTTKGSRLREKYEKEVSPKLMAEYEIKNSLSVPVISKVIVNMGIGSIAKDKEALAQAKVDLAAITGQVPSIRQAKVSVASFGVRKGMNVGLKVTLRGGRMYDFLDKLMTIVLPRLRDFRGVSVNSFDLGGNYSLGIYEHIVFPEIDITKSSSKGLEVTIVLDKTDKKQAKKFLELMGMPFEKTEQNDDTKKQGKSNKN